MKDIFAAIYRTELKGDYHAYAEKQMSETLAIRDKVARRVESEEALLEYNKRCPMCGTFFVPEPKHKIYCCASCTNAAMQKRYRERKRGVKQND